MTLAGAGLAGADSVPDAKGTASAALKAYAAMDYTQAGKLARTIPHTSEGRLVSGLCDVYDRTRQDIRRGQLTLAELFYNDKTPLLRPTRRPIPAPTTAGSDCSKRTAADTSTFSPFTAMAPSPVISRSWNSLSGAD